MEEEREMAHGQQVLLTDTEDYHNIKVAVPIKSHDVFSYIKTFHSTFEGVDLIPYEDENKQEFKLEGTLADVETVKKRFLEMVNQIVGKRIVFQDDGYFSNNDGQQFIIETLEKDCQVLCETHNKWDKMADGQNKHQKRLNLTKGEHNGHSFCSWKIHDKYQVVLAESKVDDIPSDVIVNIMDLKSRGDKLHWNSKSCPQKICLPVPKYVPGNGLDTVNKSFTEVFHGVIDDKLGSVAVSIDNTGSWPVTGIVPRIIRSFAGVFRENIHDTDLEFSLLLCSAVTENFKSGEKIIQRILKEEYEKEENRIEAVGLPMQVRIIRGKLHEIKADVLVNTTAPDLNLSIGTVSRSLLNAAGKDMQLEINNKYTSNIEPGDIAVTRGWKLICKHVIHGVLHDFKEGQEERKYRKHINQFVKVCLTEASKLKCRTIAFPAIGTGRLAYPLDIVASEMLWAVEEFGIQNTESTLKEVLFVLHPDDEHARKVFKDEQAAQAEERQKGASRSQVVFHLIGPASNIDKAEKNIQDRLDLIQTPVADEQGKKRENLNWTKADRRQDPNTEEIHGVSREAYNLLMHFHEDVLLNWQQQGYHLIWEYEILKIRGNGTSPLLVVKKEIEMFNEDIAKLPRAVCDVKGIDHDIIDSFVSRDVSEVCYIYNQKAQNIVVCGRNSCLVTEKQTVLNEIKKAFEKSSKLISVEKLSAEIYQVMCCKYSDLREYIIAYGKQDQIAMVNKTRTKEFHRRLLEVENLQRSSIMIPDDKKNRIFQNSIEYSCVRDVICIYNFEEAIVTVFGDDLKTVQEELHKLKIKAGLIEQTNRNKRELTESFEHPCSSKLGGSTSVDCPLTQRRPSSRQEVNQSIKYKSTNQYAGGARPKDFSRVKPLIRGSYNSETFYSAEGLPVKVYTKNILRLNVDCIVNAANEALKHGGGIAKVISNAAGRSLEKECNDFIKDNGKLNTAAVFVSNAGRLSYKCIIHAVGPRWADYNPSIPDSVDRCKQALKNAVLNSFKEAERRHMDTIAVPAISSAIFGVPKDICTKMYAEAVRAYSKQSKVATRLKEIHFVDSYPTIINSIQQRFREMLKSSPAQEAAQTCSGKPRKAYPTDKKVTSKTDSQDTKQYSPGTVLKQQFPYYNVKAYDAGFKQQLHCFFSPMLQLIVEQGSVFERSGNVDAVICSDTKAGSCKGYLAKTLLAKGSKSYKAAKEKAFKRVNFGDVIVLNGEGTGFGKVLIAVMWNKDPNDDETKRQAKFRQMFNSVFTKAVAQRCESVVMPLLFTGQGGVKPEFCIDRFLESCMEFSKDDTRNKLTIYLVNIEKWKTEIIERSTMDFVNIQTAMALSSRVCPLPSKPPHHVKKRQNAGSSNQSTREQEKIGSYKPFKPAFTKAQPSKNQDKSSVDSMTSSFKTFDVDSTGSKSKFDVNDEPHHTSHTYVQHTEMQTMDTNDDNEKGADDYSDESTGQQEQEDDEENNCVICMDTVSRPKNLKCGHIFCTDCIDSYFTNYKKVCPTCGVVCGVIKGDQPTGRMDVHVDDRLHCAGYEGAGCIIITYNFNSGVQGPDHPDPGKPYKGITRTAYIPNTKDGREVWKMLEVAFDRKLVFTIGSSRTTGHEGVITWNDIHHKTNPNPNAPFGYPDPGYLDRVKDELAVKGVTPEDIPASYRSS